ncbi:MAG: tRNA pseudouridine(55) synthase TruB [Planctomycetota bacterium]|jgi:tRNA pseudouridine(55) synthase
MSGGVNDGVLVLDKAAGISSAKALNAVKQRFGRKTKVGHAGTLDPFATGVLLALVGDATRLSALAMALDKEYRATVRFGWRTDTLDPDGEVVAELDPGRAPPDGLDEAVRAFVGEIEQQPPAYSALKVNGRRAYDLARKGEATELAPRRVHVYAMEIESVRWPEVDVLVRCGQGTYIRALARDLGEALGLPASLTALRRTAIGPFREPGDELVAPLRLARAAGLDEIDLDAAEARRFVAGGVVRVSVPDGEPVAVRVRERLIGLGAVRGHVLAPRAVLAHARSDLEDLRL